MPKVSFIMPLYNRADLVLETLDSLAKQTFSDFEIIIVDDYSKDESCKVVEEYSDKRIKLIRNEQNMGVAKTLNRAIENASGEFLARMDSDDLCAPTRLAEQLAVMEACPEVGICFTWAKSFGDSSKAKWQTPIDTEVMRAMFLFNHNIAHPTAMFRTSLFEKHGLRYRENSKAEDFDLWSRAIDCFPIVTIPKYLFMVRQHGERLMRNFRGVINADADSIRRRNLEKFGIAFSTEELDLHNRYAGGEPLSVAELEAVSHWLQRLLDHNMVAKMIRPDALMKGIAESWYIACLHNGEHSPDVTSIFRSFIASRHVSENPLMRLYRHIKVRRANG